MGGVPEDIRNLTGPPGGGPSSIPIGGPGPVPGGPGPGGPPDLGGGAPGLPPELMAALGGGGPGGPPDQGGDQLSDDPVTLLNEVIDRLSHYIDVETDDIDKQTILKALTTIQGVNAKDQKEAEAAQGTTPAHKGMAKAITR